ncbi:hypothetical protein [Mycobacterium numidiamassiliense]|uniref:hypothetical protein n=1 Tax=Mycobacterium numidiamassiliense TaxID=1841861 RepID=UPI001FE5766C|nr:hypothetical protein [Mycobacterium numidiamassiliense]
MPFDENSDFGIEGDLVSMTRRTSRQQCFDKSIFGEFAMLVVLIGWAAALNSPGDAVGIPNLASRYPHAAAQVLAGDLPVLPDAKRRSTGHNAPCGGLRTMAPRPNVCA